MTAKPHCNDFCTTDDKKKPDNTQSCDRFGRTIRYLRISVTDLCNLKCTYCAIDGCVPKLRHRDLLSFEEITDVVKTAVALGFDKFRLTGGEPLMRKNIETLVAMITSINGVKDLGLTTNGITLARHAQSLADAGLSRINISLDSVDEAEYEALTGGGNLRDVRAGITAAQKAGLNPIKLNCVVNKTPAEPRAMRVAEFAKKEGLEVRYITQMDLQSGHFAPVIGGDGGHCATCDRLRMTCTGNIMPCLFSNAEYNVRELGAKNAIKKAIKHKPESGQASSHRFWEIGG